MSSRLEIVEILKQRINLGITTIFVEGKTDVLVYKRFFPNAEFFGYAGFGRVIKMVTLCNDRFGKTEYVLGIIDKDNRTKKEIEELLKENIFVLKIKEIELIFLLEEVIANLYGIDFFYKFSQMICEKASIRINKKITDYEEAINVIIGLNGSKLILKYLLQELQIDLRNNSQRVETMCRNMDATDSWSIVRNLIPEV